MEIQNLLGQKKFEALNPQEQLLVLQEMTQKEYEIQHQTILLSQEILAKEATELTVPAPNAQLLMALKQKQNKGSKQEEKEEKKKPFLAALFSYQIPAWQAVAAALLLVFMAQFWTNNQEDNLFLLADGGRLIDTVIVEKTIIQKEEILQPSDTVYKVVYRTKYVSDSSSAKPRQVADAGPSSLEEKEMAARRNPMFANVMDYYNKPKNKPASQDTFLQIVNQKVQL